jgi:hypothetical protein
VFIAVVRDTFTGSRAVYLVVVPVLAAIIANRYRTAPRGVGDAESDWIVAMLFGVGCFTTILLITHRLPSIAALWQLNLISLVVWVACSTAVVFGIRYASRMAALWLFTLCCASPLPYLFVTAYLGGSNTAAALLAAGLGATALFISGRATPIKWRVAASAACLATGGAMVVAFAPSNLLLTVAAAAGLVPAAFAVVLHHFTGFADGNATVRATQRSWVPFTVLAALAIGLLATNASTLPLTTPPVARDDWTARSQLGPPVQFPFITRFMGPGTTLTRYSVPPDPGFPAAAVDVITTSNIGALRDYSQAAWYPTDAPVNFTRIDVGGPLPVIVKMAHNNADSITGSDGHDWYALTWVWQTSATVQRVTVIVNQGQSEVRAPPNPRSLSLQNTVIEPLLWIARQQPDSLGDVDNLTVRRAGDIARRLLSAGSSTRD